MIVPPSWSRLTPEYGSAPSMGQLLRSRQIRPRPALIPRPKLDQRRMRSSFIVERLSIPSIAIQYGDTSQKTLSARPRFPPWPNSRKSLRKPRKSLLKSSRRSRSDLTQNSRYATPCLAVREATARPAGLRSRLDCFFLRQQLLGPANHYFSPLLHNNTGAMPFAQQTACREGSDSSRVSQFFIRDFDLHPTRPFSSHCMR